MRFPQLGPEGQQVADEIIHQRLVAAHLRRPPSRRHRIQDRRVQPGLDPQPPVRIKLVLCAPLPPRHADRQFVQRRRDGAAEPHIRPDALHQVTQRRTAQQRIERPPQPGPARPGLDRIDDGALFVGHLVWCQWGETGRGHRGVLPFA